MYNESRLRPRSGLGVNQERDSWRILGEAFVQQWTVIGWYDTDDESMKIMKSENTEMQRRPLLSLLFIYIGVKE